MMTYNCFGEYFCDNRFSIYINLLTTIVGVFIGFGFSLLIYYNQIKKEKNKEENLKTQNNKDLLKYYSALISKVLSVAEKELELLDEYMLKQKEELTILQILQKVPSYDFERLKNIDNRGVFEAWTSIFHDKDIIIQYQITNSAIDILDGVINEVHEIHKFINLECYNKMLDIKSIVDHIPDRLSSIAFEMHKQLGDARNKDEFYLTIDKYIIKYMELVNAKSSLKEFNDDLITPLHKEVFDNFKDNPYADEIITLCKKARVKLNDVEIDVTNGINDFKKVKNKVAESISILKKTHNKIIVE